MSNAVNVDSMNSVNSVNSVNGVDGRAVRWVRGVWRGFAWGAPIVVGVVCAVVLSLVVAPAVGGWRALPGDVGSPTIAGQTVITDSKGGVVATLWEENRVPVKSLGDVSTFLVDALVATEDSRFYQNDGFDVRGTVRSALSGSGGGSGITQQLVKNLRAFDVAGRDRREATERTITRKIRELKLALGYEKTHSKDEILVGYFNTVAFGSPTTYGVEAASRRFFGKRAVDVSVGEAAMLVGTVQNPALFDLGSVEPSVVEARNSRFVDVLGRMRDEGKISAQQYDELAVSPPVPQNNRPSGGTCESSVNPWWCQYTIDSFLQSPRYGETVEERHLLLARGGLTIKTTLDPVVQDTINSVTARDYGATGKLVAPTSVVEVGTGRVLGFGVNRRFGSNPDNGETQVNLALTRKGAGSVFKAVTLGAATVGGLRRNDLVFPSLGCPLSVAGYDVPEGGIKNSNSCALQGGTLNYRQAMAYSSNTWFATLETKIGVLGVKDFAGRIGLPAGDGIGERSLSYTLGTTEHSTVDFAAALATFSAGGLYCKPTPIDSVVFEDGSTPRVPDTFDPASEGCRRVMSPEGASIVNEAMIANIHGGSQGVPHPFGGQYALPGGVVSGGKSGTNELAVQTWGQTNGRVVSYTALFDPLGDPNGIERNLYRGVWKTWGDHTTGFTGRDILAGLGGVYPPKPIPVGSVDVSLPPTVVDQSGFVNVPSLVGLTPEAATALLGNMGIGARVSVRKEPAGGLFPSNTVVGQDVEAGTRLAVGTTRVVTLIVTE